MQTNGTPTYVMQMNPDGSTRIVGGFFDRTRARHHGEAAAAIIVQPEPAEPTAYQRLMAEASVALQREFSDTRSIKRPTALRRAA